MLLRPLAFHRIIRSSLLLVLFAGWTFSLCAQSDVEQGSEMLLLRTKIVAPSFAISTSLLSLPVLATERDTPQYLSLASFQQAAFPTQEQPLCYAASELAFFCRLEVKMEKATKMPVRFRLGDVQQVDYLEGKFDGWRYGY